MSKNITRNVRIVGLEFRDLRPGTVIHKTGTHPRPRRSCCSRSCYSGPLLLYAQTSWCLCHLIRGFVCVFIRGDNLWRCSFPACSLFWRHSVFPYVSRNLSKFHTACWKRISCYVTTTVLSGHIYPSIKFNLNLFSWRWNMRTDTYDLYPSCVHV
jgi:hypothetical protein